MILAGDIGGTKTNLGLFEVENGRLVLQDHNSFPSREYVGLETIVSNFTGKGAAPLVAACFGIAGPIVDGRAVTPNLPWIVSSDSLARTLHLESVSLINDLEATAYGIPALETSEFFVLNEGVCMTGNAVLVAAGTGLGVASLFWDGKHYVPSASEGGHIDYAPRNPMEGALLKHMHVKFGRVSAERIISGPGVFNVYEYLRDSGYAPESPEIASRFATDDPPGVVSRAALAHECKLCEKALDLCVAAYGAFAGDMALVLKAVGGVYIGGGIAPKIIDKLKDGTFIGAFIYKGRMSSLVSTIPVRIIMNDKTALLGAARVAAGMA